MDTTYFRSFDQLRVNELSVIRNGWFRPFYELTDGQFIYGKVSYNGWARQIALLETAGNSWTITRNNLISRTLFITRANAETVGEMTSEVWSHKINIVLNNGFKAVFTTKKFFSRLYTLISDQRGDLYNIDQKIWKWKTPFIITFDQRQMATIPDAALLIITGVYLALLRQQQAAAEH